MPAEKEGGPAERPTAELMRKRLRTALVDARREAGLTQEKVAKALDWSKSKVVRIEQGTVSVSPTDCQAILMHYEVDPDRIAELTTIARDARRAWSWKKYEDILHPTFKDMITEEGAVTSVWKHEPSVIPGQFQTDSYAQALLRHLGENPKDVARRAEVRMIRQSILDDVDSIPEMHVVIGEAALLRPVGDADIMREQVARLLEFSERPEITLHLLLLSAGAHRGMGHPFTVHQFNDPELNDSLYLNDGKDRFEAPENLGDIEKHLDIYNELEEKADSTSTFLELARRFLDLWDQGGTSAAG